MKASAVIGYVRRAGLRKSIAASRGAIVSIRFHIFVRYRGAKAFTGCPQGVEIFPDATDLLRALRSGRQDLPTEFYRDEMIRGGRCSVATVEGRLAGVAWAYEHPIERPHLILGPGEVELSASYTLPEFRGRGLYRTLMRFAVDWMHGEHERIFTMASHDNLTPLKTFVEIGFEEVAVLRRPSIFGPRFDTRSMRIQTWGQAFSDAVR